MHTNRTFLAMKSKGLAVALTATLATAGLGFGAAPLSSALAEESAGTAPTAGAVATTAEAPAPADEAQTAQGEAAAQQPVQTTSVIVSVTDRSAVATQMYDAINQARADQGLAPLDRDVNLEAAAWQRAAETTVLQAPVRPDGSAVTQTPTNMTIASQLLLADAPDKVGTAADALGVLQADQNAAQSLASTDVATMGVALVQTSSGNMYWAILLSADMPSTTVAASGDAVDGTHDYTVAIPTANMAPATSESVDLTLAPGSTKQLYPVAHATGQIEVDGTQYPFDTMVTLGENSTATWESSAPGVVSVDGAGKLTVVSSGSAVVSAKTASGTTSWSVTVSGADAQGDVQADAEQPQADVAPEETPDEAPADAAPQADPTQVAGDAQADVDAAQTATQIDLAQCTIVGPTELEVDDNGNVIEPTYSVTAPDGSDTIPADQYTADFDYDAKSQMGILTITANPDSLTLTGTLAKEIYLSQEAQDKLAALDAAQQTPDANDATNTNPDADNTGTPTTNPADSTGADANTGQDAGDASASQDANSASASQDASQSSQTGQEANNSAQSTATDIAAATVTLDASNYPYTGSAVAPEPTVKVGDVTLVKGTDYTLDYTDNVDPGLVTITITGTGAYTGTRTTTFNIVQNGKSTLTDAGFKIAAIDDQTYTGAAITPEVSVSNGTTTLSKGASYTVTYADNLNAGTASVTVSAAEGSDYSGSLTTTFTIAPVPMSALRIEMPNQFYTGMALQPNPRSVSMLSGFVLSQGTDYEVVSYRDNVEIGTAYATLQGKGNFSGTVEAAFKIVENTNGNTDEKKDNEAAGVSTTLPATGDTTSVAPLIAGAVAGAALIGSGVVLVARKRKQN